MKEFAFFNGFGDADLGRVGFEFFVVGEAVVDEGMHTISKLSVDFEEFFSMFFEVLLGFYVLGFVFFEEVGEKPSGLGFFVLVVETAKFLEKSSQGEFDALAFESDVL